MFIMICTVQSAHMKYNTVIKRCITVRSGRVVLQLGLDVWKRLLAEPLKDTIVTLLLAELHRYLMADVIVPATGVM